jgi:hypothetical protein
LGDCLLWAVFAKLKSWPTFLCCFFPKYT